MWFLQLSTFHPVSIIYDHVFGFFCLKSLLVNQLCTVWKSVVPKWRSVWSTVGWSTLRWDDDVIMSHQNKKKIETFKGALGWNNKIAHWFFHNDFRQPCWQNPDLHGLELTCSRGNRLIGVSSRHLNPFERRKSIIKHLLFAKSAQTYMFYIYMTHSNNSFCLKSIQKMDSPFDLNLWIFGLKWLRRVWLGR